MSEAPLPLEAAPWPVPSPALVLAGVVLRPPRAAWDGHGYCGPRLRESDDAQAKRAAGLVKIVVRGDFVGIVALTEAHAMEAAVRLRLDWADPAPPDGHTGYAPELPVGATVPLVERRYRWPRPEADAAQAVAWRAEGRLWVEAPCEAPLLLRRELAALLHLPVEAIEIRVNGPARGDAIDLACDAALLATAVGRPVRTTAAALEVQWLETSVAASTDDTGRVSACRIRPALPARQRPSWARMLAGGAAGPGGNAMAVFPPYAYRAVSLATPAAADGPGPAVTELGLAAAHVFAHESFIDELARERSADPVDYRLQHLDDERGQALIRNVVQQAGVGAPARGRGVAYACVVDPRHDPPTRTWAAWVAEVSVDRATGDVLVSRVVVGMDSEDLRPSAADLPHLENDIRQATRRLLERPRRFDDPGGPPAGDEALSVVPSVELVACGDGAMQQGPLAWREVVALPAAAAVANAIFDATGVRLREPPFNGPAVRQALQAPAPRRLRSAAAWLGGLGAALAALLATAWPWPSAIAPVVQADLSVYSAAAVARGRLVAASGDCAVCHTAPGSPVNAGGLGLETPFGTIYSTNITPDAETGIGAWSFAAFERAMRQGVHRDGRHLYPAFPYTAFAKMTEPDLQALYAYLMSQPPVRSVAPATRLAFPYGFRPAMSGWNLLFHDNRVYRPDPSRSDAWNRGAYLVQGAGHCGACHTPRNLLGAEKSAPQALLAGGEAEGWEAPALNALSKAPLPWDADDLFAYLRRGYSPRHGAAAGPMAPVIHGLAELPDSDIRAMADYLFSLNPATPDAPARDVLAVEAGARGLQPALPLAGARLFQGACAVCHEPGQGPTLFGTKPSLALTTSLQSDRPTNLLQVILHGIQVPAHDGLGTMPGFKDSLGDAQVAALAAYLRARFAPDRPAWEDVASTVKRLRAAHTGRPDPRHVDG